MAKSTGNAYTLSEIEARGFEPMALRYFFMTASYRSRLNFTFRALQASQTSLERLRSLAYQLLTQADPEHAFSDASLQGEGAQWRDKFLDEIENDLNMPSAMAVVWAMLRSQEQPTTKLRLLLDMDRILGFGLKHYLQSEQPERLKEPETYLAAVPVPVATQVRERALLREQHEYQLADQVRQHLRETGYLVRDAVQGPLVLPRRLDEEFPILTRSTDAEDSTQLPDLYEFSLNILAHNNCDDLRRCIDSICRSVSGHALEIVVIDNGSTDETLPYLQQLGRQGNLQGAGGETLGLHVLFADHNMGFAAGRNATMRTSRGRFIILIDTSIEVQGDIWTPLAQTLSHLDVGVAGPYGLVTEDLREFQEASGPNVDAIEGYLLAMRRELLPEVGWIDEKFRFYRLMDIYYSFFFKAAGYRAVAVPAVAERIEKHPHREWYSLSEDEQRTKSKKNFDIFRDRWHHGESLLVANYDAQNLWPGHDHAYHLEGTHTHMSNELPPSGEMHSHSHHHWPDHTHEHPHFHHETP